MSCMAEATSSSPTPMAPIVIGIIGLFVALSVSGGIGGAGLAGADSKRNSEVAGAADSRETDTASSSGRGSFFSRFGSADEAEEVTPTYKVPTVETLPALNVEDRTVSLRGKVNMFAGEKGVVFVAYGYDLKSVRNVNSGYTMYKEIPEATSDKVRTYVLDNRAKGEKEYNRRVSNLIPDATYYYKVCVEYTNNTYDQVIKCGNVKDFSTNNRYSNNNNFTTPRASVSRAYDVTAQTAVIPGRVQMNDGVDGIAFIAFGKDREQVINVENFATYRSVEEDGDNLQRFRIGAFVRGQANYNETIYALDSNQIYYYRLCVEYTGDRDGLVCSGVSQFTTDKRNRPVLPYAETNAATVTNGKVTLNGLVQMNSYNNGVSFMVVGSDQTKVEGVTNSSTFANLRQSGYDLQKVLLDDDLDSTENYSRTLDFLVSGNYYYRTCVQYQGEDSYNRIKNFIKCGDVKTFKLN
jgi:hypothetical protein